MNTVRMVATARALIIKEDKLLLVSNKGQKYFTPGGWVDNFESLKEACIREVREELGIAVEVSHLVYVSEFIETAAKNKFGENLNKFEHYFACNIMGEGPAIRDGKNLWHDSDPGHTIYADWFTKAEWAGKMIPQEIAEMDIISDVAKGTATYIEGIKPEGLVAL